MKSSRVKTTAYGAWFAVTDLLRNWRYAVPLVVNRGNGPKLTGPITLALLGAPRGLKLTPDTIAEAESAVLCKLEADGTAPVGVHTVQIVAECGGEIVGFVGVRVHNPASAEIHVMGVLPSHHGRGVGRALVEHVEAELRARGFEFLEVKTLGPRRPNAAYAQTRAFYERVGFRPLEENDLWGSVNPCLIMVKHLACGRESHDTSRERSGAGG